MRASWIVIAVVLVATTARAQDRRDAARPAALTYGLAGEAEAIDVRGGAAWGWGLSLHATFGHGRLQALADVGAGGLLSMHPFVAVGGYGELRFGARLVAVTMTLGRVAVADLAFDAGLGVARAYLVGAAPVNRPYAFAGWGTVLRGRPGRGFDLTLRVAVSPPMRDAAALRVICRGTCPAAPPEPVDLTLMVAAGVLRW